MIVKHVSEEFSFYTNEIEYNSLYEFIKQHKKYFLYKLNNNTMNKIIGYSKPAMILFVNEDQKQEIDIFTKATYNFLEEDELIFVLSITPKIIKT